MTKKRLKSYTLALRPLLIILTALAVSEIYGQKSGLKRKNKDKSAQSISAEEAMGPKPVHIKWRNVERAASYQFLLTDSDGAEVINRNITNPEITVDLTPGKYFFQVAAVTSTGAVGDFSEKSQIQVYPKGSPEEMRERVKSIEKISTKIAQVGGESELGEIGLGRANMAGGSFEYMLLNQNMDPFVSFMGASFHFRYYKLFIKNLKPEARIGFSRGHSQHESLTASISLFRAYASLGYSFELKKRTLFLMPMAGVGANYFHLSSDTLGRVYLRTGISGALEFSYQPTSALQLYLRGEYIHVLLNGDQDTSLIVPSFGLAYKF